MTDFITEEEENDFFILNGSPSLTEIIELAKKKRAYLGHTTDIDPRCFHPTIRKFLKKKREKCLEKNEQFLN